MAWSEELIDRACAFNHPRLPMLYVLAAECYAVGRLDDSIAFAEAAHSVLGRGDYAAVPHDFELGLAATYVAAGQPDRMLEMCRTVIAKDEGPHCLAAAYLVMALLMTGRSDEAIATSERTLRTAEATNNPALLSFALLAHGLAYREAHPRSAFDSLRRGLAVAHDGGVRMVGSHISAVIGGLSAEQGQPAEALHYLALSIRHFFDGASSSHLCAALGTLTAVMDRLGYHEAAATISGDADIQFTRTINPALNITITHLRQTLGDENYEALASTGENMTLADITNYALMQVDRARSALASPDA